LDYCWVAWQRKMVRGKREREGGWVREEGASGAWKRENYMRGI